MYFFPPPPSHNCLLTPSPQVANYYFVAFPLNGHDAPKVFALPLSYQVDFWEGAGQMLDGTILFFFRSVVGAADYYASFDPSTHVFGQMKLMDEQQWEMQGAPIYSSVKDQFVLLGESNAPNNSKTATFAICSIGFKPTGEGYLIPIHDGNNITRQEFQNSYRIFLLTQWLCRQMEDSSGSSLLTQRSKSILTMRTISFLESVY